MWTVILGIAFVIFGITGGFLLGLGWAWGNDKNANLVAASCATDNYKVSTGSCSVYCCTKDSDGNCQNCARTCYIGYILVNISGVAFDSSIEVGRTFVSAVSILADMRIAYPIGSPFSCYYDRTTAVPGVVTAAVSVQLTLNYTQGYLIAGVFMLSLAAIALIVWLIITFPVLIGCCGGMCDDCCDSCRRRKRQWIQTRERKREESRQREQRQREQRDQDQDLDVIREMSQHQPPQTDVVVPSAPPAIDVPGLRASELIPK